MRLINLIKGDLHFQYKHGFYFIYAILTLVYICFIALLPKEYKSIVTTYILFTDPVTAGLFFMGAIILFEKSQRVLNSLAISPIRVSEYIISKVISLSLIAIIVGIVLIVFSNKANIINTIIGIILGSIMFTLISLIVAPIINSINQFILYVVPIGIACFIPSMYYLFFSQNKIWLIHPCNLILYIMTANSLSEIFLEILLSLIWIILFYFIAYRNVSKMFRSVGGVKLWENLM